MRSCCLGGSPGGGVGWGGVVRAWPHQGCALPARRLGFGTPVVPCRRPFLIESLLLLKPASFMVVVRPQLGVGGLFFPFFAPSGLPGSLDVVRQRGQEADSSRASGQPGLSQHLGVAWRCVSHSTLPGRQQGTKAQRRQQFVLYPLVRMWWGLDSASRGGQAGQGP